MRYCFSSEGIICEVFESKMSPSCDYLSKKTEKALAFQEYLYEVLKKLRENTIPETDKLRYLVLQLSLLGNFTFLPLK